MGPVALLVLLPDPEEPDELEEPDEPELAARFGVGAVRAFKTALAVWRFAGFAAVPAVSSPTAFAMAAPAEVLAAGALMEFALTALLLPDALEASAPDEPDEPEEPVVLPVLAAFAFPPFRAVTTFCTVLLRVSSAYSVTRDCEPSPRVMVMVWGSVSRDFPDSSKSWRS